MQLLVENIGPPALTPCLDAFPFLRVLKRILGLVEHLLVSAPVQAENLGFQLSVRVGLTGGEGLFLVLRSQGSCFED